MPTNSPDMPAVDPTTPTPTPTPPPGPGPGGVPRLAPDRRAAIERRHARLAGETGPHIHELREDVRELLAALDAPPPVPPVPPPSADAALAEAERRYESCAEHRRALVAKLDALEPAVAEAERQRDEALAAARRAADDLTRAAGLAESLLRERDEARANAEAAASNWEAADAQAARFHSDREALREAAGVPPEATPEQAVQHVAGLRRERDALLADIQAGAGIVPCDEDGPENRTWIVPAEPGEQVCDTLREALEMSLALPDEALGALRARCEAAEARAGRLTHLAGFARESAAHARKTGRRREAERFEYLALRLVDGDGFYLSARSDIRDAERAAAPERSPAGPPPAAGAPPDETARAGDGGRGP